MTVSKNSTGDTAVSKSSARSAETVKHGALVFDIKRYAINDGPGIRVTLFFKGCSLACTWCHNPESISPQVQKMYSAGKCIGCGRCYKVCPREVFELVEREGLDLASDADWDDDDDDDDGFADDTSMVMNLMNALDCIGCQACSKVCPKDCLSHEPQDLAA